MKQEIKSGKQILDEFFQEIKNLSNIDESVVNTLIKLHESGKLSEKSIANALLELREKLSND